MFSKHAGALKKTNWKYVVSCKGGGENKKLQTNNPLLKRNFTINSKHELDSIYIKVSESRIYIFKDE